MKTTRTAVTISGLAAISLLAGVGVQAASTPSTHLGLQLDQARFGAFLTGVLEQPAPPLVKVLLSPRAPVQGDEVTAFVSVTGFQSPQAVRTFVQAKLDGSDISGILHPSDQLWVVNLGSFQAIGAHTLSISTVLEDESKAQAIRDHIISLNSQILDLQSQISAEQDPAKKSSLQTELTEKISERQTLEDAILALRSPVGTDQTSFSVAANTESTDFPHIASVDPNFAVPQTRGGITQVTIHGTGFTSASQVLIGGNALSPVQFVDSSTLQVSLALPASVKSLTTGSQDVEVRVPTADTDYKNAILANGFFVANAPLSSGGPAQVHPVAFAGYPLAPSPVGQAVTLDGSLSYSDNGDPLSYQWHFVSLPEGSQLNDSVLNAQPAQSKAQFTPDQPGSYVIALTVSDGVLTSAPSLTTVTAYTDPARLVLSPASTTLETNVGQTLTQIVLLTNGSGKEPLVVENLPIKSGDSANELSISLQSNPMGGVAQFPIWIAPGQAVPLVLTYKPATEHPAESVSFTFFGHDSINVSTTLTVSLVADPPIELTLQEPIPNTTPNPLYPSSGGAEGVLYVPSAEDTQLTQSVTLVNHGTTDLTIQNPPEVQMLSSQPFPDPSLFTVDPKQFPLTIPAAGQKDVSVQLQTQPNNFPPGQTTELQAQMIWNLGSSVVQTQAVSWRVAPGTLYGPLSAQFSGVAAGATSTQTVQLTKALIAPGALYRVSALSITGTNASAFAYALPPGINLPYIVTPQGAQTGLPYPDGPINVTFSPPAAGTYSATLQVTIDGFSQALDIPLSGSTDTGTTTCTAPQSACPTTTGGTFCTDLSKDNQNCGACGTVCGTSQTCSAGQCVAARAPGQAIIDQKRHPGRWLKAELQKILSDLKRISHHHKKIRKLG